MIRKTLYVLVQKNLLQPYLLQPPSNSNLSTLCDPSALTLPTLRLGALSMFALEAMDAEESQEEEEEKGSNLIKAHQK